MNLPVVGQGVSLLASLHHDIQSSGTPLIFGSGIAEFLYGAMAVLAKIFLQTDKLHSHDLKAFTYGEVNALLKPPGKA